MMNLRSTVISFLLLTSNLLGAASLYESDGAMTLTTIYGSVIFNEPVLLELIKSPGFDRLKHIHQYGIVSYVRKDPDYMRYEHSLGVFFLTRMFGAPLAEQVAALLHDVSYTVFSHIGDHVFNHRGFKTSYQDEIHEWHLAQSGIGAILHKYGLEGCCSLTAKKKQRCFDQDLPDLGADRIEYNLYGGYIDRLLTIDEVKQIVEHLHFEHDQWFFDTVEHTKQFALVSVRLSEQRWEAAWNVFADTYVCKALKRAVSLGLISQDEILFSTDDAVWNKLQVSTDDDIQQALHTACHYNTCYCLSNTQESDFHLRGHFSGTNPLIKTPQGLVRLTELDIDYKAEYERVKKAVKDGFYVKVCENN
jgi:HD superfamily phosphohydrolase